MWEKQKRSGFTIVELLIVIVVIGILAAITIVAYNGIQERARMSKALSFAAQLKRTHLNDAVVASSFDNCSGNSASSSTGPNPTVTGTLQWSNDTPSGSGCSLQFTGTQRLFYDVRLSSTYYLKSVWVKMTSCTGGNNIISDGDTSSSGLVSTAVYAPVQGSACIIRSGHNNAWGSVIDTISLADGMWHHIAVEFSADAAATTGVLKLYKDGTLVSSSVSVLKPENVDTMPILIGSHKGSNNLVGLLDDPLIIAK